MRRFAIHYLARPARRCRLRGSLIAWAAAYLAVRSAAGCCDECDRMRTAGIDLRELCVEGAGGRWTSGPTTRPHRSCAPARPVRISIAAACGICRDA